MDFLNKTFAIALTGWLGFGAVSGAWIASLVAPGLQPLAGYFGGLLGALVGVVAMALCAALVLPRRGLG